MTLDNLAGFGWERPFLGVAMWFFVFGFAGLPVGGGFVGKFYVFAAAYDHGWTWLVIVGVARDARQPLLLPRDRAGDVHAPGGGAPGRSRRSRGGSPAREPLLHVAVGIALVVSVGSLFAVQPLIRSSSTPSRLDC